MRSRPSARSPPERKPAWFERHRSYLAAHRYKEPGLRTRALWEEVWALQRRQDAGETLDIAVPPKYKPTDFKTTAYWRNRGKLDVVNCIGGGRDIFRMTTCAREITTGEEPSDPRYSKAAP